MTSHDLIKTLKILSKKALDGGDKESLHVDADQALLDYIGDDKVRKAFESIEKWYA